MLKLIILTSFYIGMQLLINCIKGINPQEIINALTNNQLI